MGTSGSSIDGYMDRLRRNNAWYAGSAPSGEPALPAEVDGINVCGYFRDESGLGENGRMYVRALNALGVPLSLIDLSGLTSNRSEDRTFTEFDDRQRYGVNLVCVNAGEHFATMTRAGADLFEGRYNIGLWVWELPRFPQKWYDRFAYYDEIWTPTSFVADTLSPVAPIPVVKIPPVLEPQAYGSREDGRRRLGVSPDKYVFLFVFDFHSHLPRKNPGAVIEAFKRAFRADDPVRLVIKSVNGDSDPAGLESLKTGAAGHRIDLYDGYWSGGEVRDLKAACDAFVSLHRSEGIGLNLSDAMAHGKPVIATGWSGNMDFMSVANSYPVRYRLVENEKTVGPYGKGETWAEPSVEHAAELMRHVSLHRVEAEAVGRLAQEEIRSRFSEGRVAEAVGKRLGVIACRHRLPEFRREVKAFYSGYRSLAGRIRLVADEVIPENSTVLVVSKGDGDLLDMGGRTALHFPSTPEGVYAGSHPADSAAAVEGLETWRARGADYLVFPGTAFWWLDYYAEFRGHLDDRYRRVWDGQECVVYDL